MSEATPGPAIERFHVGEYVKDELDARGWDIDEAAMRMGGEFDINRLWLEMLLSPEMQRDAGIVFSSDEARQLAELFGTSREMWLGIQMRFLSDERHALAQQNAALLAALEAVEPILRKNLYPCPDKPNADWAKYKQLAAAIQAARGE